MPIPPNLTYAQCIDSIRALSQNEVTIPIALAKIKEWGLKVEVRNGQLVDMSDTTEAWLRRFITVDEQMMVLKDKVRKLSKVDYEVLISGETGTGKELIARALHGDRDGKFIAVNCAGIPEQLVESLLFGHVKGSFTGATDTRQGYMQLAKGGTLFLDEVGELPLQSQAKFLRAIQEKKIMKVGGDKEEDIACRFVFATHRDLVKLVAGEQFRQDLYARITTFLLHISPLRNRLKDIPSICEQLDGGKELLSKILPHKGELKLDLSLNVRSLQQAVLRYRVLGELPS